MLRYTENVYIFFFVGHFQQFDYQIEGNKKQYERPSPPDYNLTQVSAPGCIIYSNNDLIVDSNVDIPRLARALGSHSEIFLIPLSDFNHIDFVVGIDVAIHVNLKIINFFHNIRNKDYA